MDPLARGAQNDRSEQREETYATAELNRLRAENIRLTRQMEHLRATASLMLEEPDTRRLPSALAKQAVLLLDARSAKILVLQEEEVLAQGESSQSCSTPAFEWGAGAAGSAAKRMQACVCEEAGGYVLGAPILDHQQRLLGVLEVRDSRPFSADALAVAQTLALQAATGLERARLFDRMRDWTQSLEMLLSFNAAINEHLDPPQLVARLVENAARFLKADGGMAGFAVSAPGGALMLCDAYWHRGAWNEHPRRWETNEGMPGFLLESHFPYISNEYAEDRLADAALIARFDVRRALCVPIKNVDESMLGFFELHKGPGQPPFTWQDAAFLESLANTTAVAIQNVQLDHRSVESYPIRALLWQNGLCHSLRSGNH